jgi:hypothetical protein
LLSMPKPKSAPAVRAQNDAASKAGGASAFSPAQVLACLFDSRCVPAVVLPDEHAHPLIAPPCAMRLGLK